LVSFEISIYHIVDKRAIDEEIYNYFKHNGQNILKSQLHVHASNEDFPNITPISHQDAILSYQAHRQVFQQVCLIVVEAETKYIDYVTRMIPCWI
jgi:hypothetical protein